MTFSHKTVNIVFHARKFLSGKDALVNLIKPELKRRREKSVALIRSFC